MPRLEHYRTLHPVRPPAGLQWLFPDIQDLRGPLHVHMTAARPARAPNTQGNYRCVAGVRRTPGSCVPGMATTAVLIRECSSKWMGANTTRSASTP